MEGRAFAGCNCRSGYYEDEIGDQVKRHSEFSRDTRMQNIALMEEESFDLAIIGGGITGAGVARDAVSRGMRVALIEMQDFAQGTSSRSSKLIHGGIRYLENLEFQLVFEALSERRLLFEIAPHLVHPLRFVLPLYKGTRVGMFKMGLGMWLYDALSMFEAPEMHERLSAKEALERLPQLQSENLLGAYVYSDGYMDDDRLVIETLRSASEMGARCANYVKATGALLGGANGQQIQGLQCEDQITKQRFNIRARHTISTVGPWTDIVADSLVHNWKKILRPTKGVHLTLSRERFPLTQAVVMAENNRIVFGIPRHEMVIIGTTDTDFSGDPATVQTTSDDVKYLLGVAEQYFPGANLTAKDIIATYEGVRPLVDDGAETEGKTSREHVIIRDPRNVTFVAGGKYTTYRHMAEQTVEAALENFSLEERIRFQRPQTKVALNELATPDTIAQAHREADAWAKEFGLQHKTTERLIERHGAEAYQILQASSNFREENGALTRSNENEKLWCLEAEHAIRNTMCFDLLDFYIRRSPLFLAEPDHGLGLLKTLGETFAQILGWSDSKRHEAWAKVQAYVQKELSWKKDFKS
jgi:glycerol-3-phosphate dehydrogenase